MKFCYFIITDTVDDGFSYLYISGQLSLLVERNKEVERELAALRNALQEATQQNGSELSELRKQLDNVRTVSTLRLRPFYRLIRS